jgi:hypothetical protein
MNNAVMVREEEQAGQVDFMVPRTLDEAWQLCERLASSELVPKDYRGKPENILVAMQWGREIGLKPLQALQNIAVINGRPNLWGDAVLALVLASPVCRDVIETYEGEGEAKCAVCIAQRHGKQDKLGTFSIADARQAGLINKQSPWQGYPDRMLKMRARGFALRDQFADVLKGFNVLEVSREDAVNMGPADEVVRPDTGEVIGRTRTEQAKDALRKAELAALLKDIDEAITADALKACADRAGKLTNEADKETARKHYGAKLEAIGKGKGKGKRKDDAPAGEAPVDGEPVITFAMVAEALQQAKTADEVREAGTYIVRVKDVGQRAELDAVREARVREFEEAGGAQ